MDASVWCKGCEKFHPVDKVEFLNIEEDYCGRDKVTFECPQDKEEYSGLVVVR